MCQKSSGMRRRQRLPGWLSTLPVVKDEAPAATDTFGDGSTEKEPTSPKIVGLVAYSDDDSDDGGSSDVAAAPASSTAPSAPPNTDTDTQVLDKDTDMSWESRIKCAIEANDALLAHVTACVGALKSALATADVTLVSDYVDVMCQLSSIAGVSMCVSEDIVWVSQALEDGSEGALCASDKATILQAACFRCQRCYSQLESILMYCPAAAAGTPLESLVQALLAAAEAAASAATDAAAAPATAEAPTWQAVWNNEAASYYFANLSTGESTWQHPIQESGSYCIVQPLGDPPLLSQPAAMALDLTSLLLQLCMNDSTPDATPLHTISTCTPSYLPRVCDWLASHAAGCTPIDVRALQEDISKCII